MNDKLQIDRKLLERLQERLDPHIDARDWGMLCDAFRGQQSSQGGEAVEVVAYRYTSSARLGGKWHYQESFPKWDDRKVSEIGQMDALMTVAQHNRIMAAATPADSRVVPVELLERATNFGRPDVMEIALSEIRALLELKP